MCGLHQFFQSLEDRHPTLRPGCGHRRRWSTTRSSVAKKHSAKALSYGSPLEPMEGKHARRRGNVCRRPRWSRWDPQLRADARPASPARVAVNSHVEGPEHQLGANSRALPQAQPPTRLGHLRLPGRSCEVDSFSRPLNGLVGDVADPEAVRIRGGELARYADPARGPPSWSSTVFVTKRSSFDKPCNLAARMSRATRFWLTRALIVVGEFAWMHGAP